MIERQEVILSELQREEARFLETLERGEKLLAEVLASKPAQISGAQAFELYDTYGFPLELTQEIAEEQGLAVDLDPSHAELDADSHVMPFIKRRARLRELEQEAGLADARVADHNVFQEVACVGRARSWRRHQVSSGARVRSVAAARPHAILEGAHSVGRLRRRRGRGEFCAGVTVTRRC